MLAQRGRLEDRPCRLCVCDAFDELLACCKTFFFVGGGDGAQVVSDSDSLRALVQHAPERAHQGGCEWHSQWLKELERFLSAPLLLLSALSRGVAGDALPAVAQNS